MDALRAELRAEVDVIGGTLKHLTNVIVPLRAPAALAVGLATLSIANLIAMTCRHERGMDILKGLQMIPNDLPQGSFTVASNVDALRLASLLLSPQQPEWDSYQQFTQLLRQALSASDPAAELERVVDSLPAVPAQIQTRGRHRINYGDEMHVEAFLAVVEMHLEAEAEANRPLSHSWQEMLWLWEQLVGIPAVESRARLSLEDQRIILYS
ncbi:hypothetical protein DFH06DRAFT_266406 [Mycena polygramma]|nr:hypothetical protein DFH06DRAFT_266406 [Mycena polygramma]